MIFEELYKVYNQQTFRTALQNSGWILETTPKPYISLVNLGHSLETRHSCLEELIFATYQFLVYTYTKKEGELLVTALRGVYDDYNTSIVDVMEWVSDERQELIPETYLHKISYDIYFRRQANQANIAIVTEDNDTLDAGIFKRYHDFRLPWTITTSSRALERTKYPYVTIPQFDLFVDSPNSTNNQINRGTYPFKIVSNTLQSVESLADDIINVFDYANIVVTDKVISFLWFADNYIESEPGVWEADISFDAYVQDVN